MSLALYDTRTRRQRTFEPLRPGVVTMYVCGPTVQSAPHIGHMRSGVDFDVLRRWLIASGYTVYFARNVTDINDKVLEKAAAEGVPWWVIATREARAFERAYEAVGCLPPSVDPRATGHVPEMIQLISRLIEAGHAYPSDGDVYFDVRSYPAYGELSGQRPDAMIETERTETGRPKRNPLDFALWKGSEPGEPAWQTPWGAGMPGWHIECSAMATKYLGDTFDIHGGGLDLTFPHHENELAQSAAAGDGFARYWLHNGMLNIGAEKMSKSLGNSLLVADILERVRPQSLRYYLAAPHYRSSIDFSEEGMVEAEAAFGRLETFVRNGLDALGGVGEAEILAVEAPETGKAAWDEFSGALDDDLATPRAVGVLHAAVRTGNGLLAGDRRELAGWLAVVRRMLSVLGLEPVSQWPAAGGDVRPVVDALVEVALQARADARARRDFAAADGVRDALAAAGVVVEDTPAGARWHLAVS